MQWLEKLERRIGRFAIPHLTVTLIFCQLFFLILEVGEIINLERMYLVAGNVVAGEYWRLLTFLLIPPQVHIIFLIFAIYLFFLMGTALENQWGHFKYNLFFLCGWLAHVAVSFIFPQAAVSNAALGTSVFLAFAFLFPDFEILLFFVLPVKVRYLAWFTWGIYIFTFATGDPGTRIMLLASTANLFLFFGKDYWNTLRYRNRAMQTKARDMALADKPMHRCRVCGRTEKSEPQLVFRYCEDCAGAPCYCEEHIEDHEHIDDARKRS